MRRKIVIIGIILSTIGVFIWFTVSFLYADVIKQYIQSTTTSYDSYKLQYGLISNIGFFFLLIGVPLSIIGAALRSKKQKKIVLTLNCPKCNREIPFDGKVCPYCQYVL